MNFKYEEVVEKKKTLWGKEREKVMYYITHLDVVGYNPTGKFIGCQPEDRIELLVHWYDFDKLRQHWIEFKEELAMFGLEIKHIESKEVKQS